MVGSDEAVAWMRIDADADEAQAGFDAAWVSVAAVAVHADEIADVVEKGPQKRAAKSENR